jgi:anionic cell wall polymer biosynthesis LytR-Cps2A-Psr (LCP) family protein
VFKKIAKGLIALLSLLLIIIGISIFYFFQNLDKFLSNLIEKKIRKNHLHIKTLSISLKEISISNFEIPTILKGDSLKIKFSISELLRRKTIYKISAYNVVFLILIALKII